MFTDIRFEHMKRIVQYLYTGKTQIRSDELEEFFRVAKQLEILGLYHDIEADNLSIVSESASTMADASFDSIPQMWVPDRSASNRDPIVERRRQEYKRTINLNGGFNNRATNNPQPTTSQNTKNDRKRVRVEPPTQTSKSSRKKTATLSAATVPPDRTNDTSSKANEKTLSKNGAKTRSDKGEAYRINKSKNISNFFLLSF